MYPEHYEQSDDFKYFIYELMKGSINVDEFPPKLVQHIENEFEEGKPCEQLYTKVYDAYTRLSARLGEPDSEDRDVEIIIDSLRMIGEHLCMKMYDYGWHYATHKA